MSVVLFRIRRPILHRVFLAVLLAVSAAICAAIDTAHAQSSPPPASALLASFVLEDLTIAGEGATVEIRRLEVAGSLSSATEVTAMLRSARSAAAGLARLTAEAITIPELVVKTDQGPLTHSILYQDVVLRGIANGRASQVSIATATGQTLNVPKARSMALVTIGLGPTELRDVSLPEMLAALMRMPSGQTTPPEPLLGSFTALSVILSRHDLTLRAGLVTGGPVRGRHVTLPVSEFMARAPSDGDVPSAQENVDMLEMLADAARTFESPLIEVKDLTVTYQKRPPLEIAAIRMADFERSKAREVSLRDLRIDEPDGVFKLARLELGDIDLAPLAAGFSTMATRIRKTGHARFDEDQAALVPFLRGSVPAFGRFVISGVEIEPKSANAVRLSLDTLAITAREWMAGLPTALEVALETLKMDLNPDDPETRKLVEAGLTTVDLSATANAIWRPDTRTISGDASIRGGKLGTVRARLEASNAGPELFDVDPLLQQVGVVGLTLTGLEVELRDAGAVELALKAEAKKQGKSVVALKQELITGIAVQVPALLGNTDKSRRLAIAIAKFVASPTTLSIAAKAPSGIGVGDLLAPDKIIDKIELTVTNRP